MNKNTLAIFGFVAVAIIVAAIFFPQNGVFKKVPSKYPWSEHKAYFREIQSKVPNGYIDNRQYLEDRPYWYVTSLLMMYEQENNPDDLIEAVRILRILESRCQSDNDGDGFKDCKAYYIYDGIDRTQGYIADMFSHAVYTIRSNKYEVYYEDATRWAKLVDENYIPYFEKYWASYEVDGKKEGYFKGPTGQAIPFNRIAPWGTTYIWRWKDTGKDEYKEKPQQLLNRFFDENVNPVREYNGLNYISPIYDWYDNRSGETAHSCPPEDPYLCGGLTDIKHLNYEFDLLLTGYEQGLVTKSDIDKVVNGIKVSMLANATVNERKTPVLNQDMSPPRIPFRDEVNKNLFRQTGHMYNFMLMAGTGDTEMVYQFEEILNQLELSGKLNGNYYTSYFRCVKDPRSINGVVGLEFCETRSKELEEVRVENTEIMRGIAALGRLQ